MLRLPIWIRSTCFSNSLHLAGVGHLGNDGQAGLRARLDEQVERVLAQALECVGRGARLECAAAQHLRTFALHQPGGLDQLIGRLDRAWAGHDGERAARADGDLAADRDPRSVLLVLEAGQLVRAGDSDGLLDPGHGADVGDAVDVDTDDADDRALLALAHEGLQSLRPNERADGVDLRLLRVRPHHDDHLPAPFE